MSFLEKKKKKSCKVKDEFPKALRKLFHNDKKIQISHAKINVADRQFGEGISQSGSSPWSRELGSLVENLKVAAIGFVCWDCLVVE